MRTLAYFRVVKIVTITSQLMRPTFIFTSRLILSGSTNVAVYRIPVRGRIFA
jgi:hypothetical protein